MTVRCSAVLLLLLLFSLRSFVRSLFVVPFVSFGCAEVVVVQSIDSFSRFVQSIRSCGRSFTVSRSD